MKLTHTLVSKQKMFPDDVKAKLRILINDRRRIALTSRRPFPFIRLILLQNSIWAVEIL